MTLPLLKLEADFASAPAEDLTAYGRSGISITRGVTQPSLTGFFADAGTYRTTLDNITRIFDPNNLTIGTPYLTAGESDIGPGIPVRAGAKWGAPTYPLFTGMSDRWPQTYPLNGQDQNIEFSATDAIAALTAADLDIRRPAEYTGTRIVAVLDAINYPGAVDIAHGDAIVGPLQRGTISAASHLQDVVNSEWGDFFITVGGVLTFLSRDVIFGTARTSTSQATFTQDTGLEFSDVSMTDLPIINRCTVVFNDKGHSVTAENAVSITKYGLRAQTYSLPLHTATQARQWAQWIVIRYGLPITTFGSLTLTPSNEPGATNELWVQALTRELSDLITVTLDPLYQDPVTKVIAPSGDPITRNCWIRGIQREFQDGSPYATTLTLQDASWLAGLFVWDVSQWDDDVWGL